MKPMRDGNTLAARAGRGDEAAWREIFQATRHRLFALLAYQLGDRQEARDVLQETYLAAVRTIGGYRAEGSLESWLCGIALKRAADWKRRFLPRLKRTSSLEGGELDFPAARSPDPGEGLGLKRALMALPHRQRSAVLLHEWMGYSFREIGELLGMSEATARVHAFRGRATLRALLAPAACEPSVPVSNREQGS